MNSNKERDKRKQAELEAQGFQVLTIWECELDSLELLEDRLRDFWFGQAQ